MDNSESILTWFSNFLGLCFVTPVLTIFFTVLYLYRKIVGIVLNVQYGEEFAGLLEGEDVVWAVEEPTALSVINVVGLLETKNELSSDFLDKFRELMKNRLTNPSLAKLFYKRQRKYGYYFWTKDHDFRLEDRVKWLEIDYSCDGTCNDIYGDSMKKSLEKICNEPLPADHSACWEIFVGRTCPRCHVRRIRTTQEGKLLFAGRTRKITVPILFRAHHSIGDGTALTKLLLDVIADKETPEEYDSLTKGGRFMIDKKTNTAKFNDEKEFSLPVEDILGPCMPYTHLITLRFAGKFMQNCVNARINFFHSFSYDTAKNRVQKFLSIWLKRLRHIVAKNGLERVKNVGRVIAIVASAPACFVNQALKSMDNSAVHGPKLSGEKLISCWFESDFRNFNEQKLLLKMREIKNRTHARIEDIFLAALSSSFHKYLIQIKEMPPKKLSVVLPAMINRSNETRFLKNNFSVGILPLCISEANDRPLSHPMENTEIIERLRDIARAHDKLKENSDYLINWWVMKYLCAVLPYKLASIVLESHSTMILSNVPGPQVVKILGYTLKNIVCWIPNRSSTGIGCSIVSYGNDLQLSLIADKVLMRDRKCLSEILENTVREIDNLHDDVLRSSFAKKFEDAKPASMEKDRWNLTEKKYKLFCQPYTDRRLRLKRKLKYIEFH